MSGGMKDIAYPNEGGQPLAPPDITTLFNNYRLRKYLLQMLMAAGKTEMPSYRILEAGCAGGEQTRFLLENRADPAKCTCFDHSMRAMRLCRRLSPAALQGVCASALELPFTAALFHVVLCFSLFGCFRSADDRRRLAAELRRVVHPDGILLVLDINENFRRVYSRAMNEKFHSFDTAAHELEGELRRWFRPIARKGVFVSEGAAVGRLSDGTVAPLPVEYLPVLELDMERGKVPVCYTLYAFLPC